MAYSSDIELFEKIYWENAEREKLFDESLIEYSNEIINDDIYSEMEEGYKEMANLNLEYAEMGEDSLVFNEYVNWLSGE